MSNEIAAISLKALDGLDMRASAIAQNIANAGTRGYRPIQVSFEDQLRAAASQGGEAVSQVRPTMEFAPLRPGQDGVRIDLELAAASLTAGRYAALIEVLGRNLQLDALAVRGDS